MGGVVSTEAERAIKLASRGVDAKLPILVGRALSASIALVYFTSLVTYALYTRPVSETTESRLFMLQFMILSFWTGCLVDQRRDAIMIFLLAVSFIAFVHQRGLGYYLPDAEICYT